MRINAVYYNIKKKKKKTMLGLFVVLNDLTATILTITIQKNAVVSS
jgi:hypothetical protein